MPTLKIKPYALMENFEKMPIFSKVGKIWDLAEDYRPSDICYPCGYSVFDTAIDGGFRPGELITVSAQTGQGKTTWCQNLTKEFDKRGWASLWLSYEMNLWYLREKFQKIGCDENLRAYSAIDELNATLEWIEALIQEAIEDYDCRFVFIDHLHYLIPLNWEIKSFSLAVGSLVRALKKMAVRKNIVMFLIAHTKKIYQQEKLDLSSIRDSSLIAQESDYVFLIERIKKESGKLDGENSEWTNQAKITLAKNRRTGDCRFILCNHINGQFLEITNNYGEAPDEDEGFLGTPKFK